MPACNYPALASNSYPQPFHVLAFSPLLGNFPPSSTQTGGPTRILATVIPIPTHISVCHSSQNAPRIPPLGLFYSMSSQQQHSPITGTILNSNSRKSPLTIFLLIFCALLKRSLRKCRPAIPRNDSPPILPQGMSLKNFQELKISRAGIVLGRAIFAFSGGRERRSLITV
ncbi:hypothetical protein BGY98DRAFT_700158 [Russula aff. rugulosa BPL654]|nr:hypothetical protein BGY98DRAFT_700158 [Russula aff. rugulosa BPL654]